MSETNRRNETRERKRRSDNNRSMNVEHGTFTPLIYSVTGGAGPEAQLFHKHSALKISTKTGDRFEKVFSLLRCQRSFLILRSVLMCVRGARGSHNSRANNSTTVEDFNLACDNARIEQ